MLNFKSSCVKMLLFTHRQEDSTQLQANMKLLPAAT